ncbi:MAG: FMN-binding protein [Clostridia bacterium]|nr:FMN-binding protein [Clostridia bacterium]
MEKEKTGIITVALKLFIICFVSTLILAFVNTLTKDVIEENNKKVFAEGCEEVLPGAARTEIVDISEYLPGAEAAVSYDAENNVMGIAIKQSIKGYNSGLVLMTGVAADGKKVTGIDILEHSETPGLGALADSKDFTEQFRGKMAPLKTEKDGGEIVAITGATKTTKGIIDNGVNKAVEAAALYFENVDAEENSEDAVPQENEAAEGEGI